MQNSSTETWQPWLTEIGWGNDTTTVTVTAVIPTTLRSLRVASGTVDDPLPFCNAGCTWTAVFVLSCVLGIAAIAANTCVIAIIRRTPEIRTQAYSVLMINLCASNLLSSLVRVILSNCAMQTLIQSSMPWCYIGEVVYSLTTLVSLTTIAAMSFDRFLGVAYHLRYGALVTTRKYSIFAIVQWLVLAAICVLPVVKHDLYWCVRRFGGCSYSNSGYIVWVQSVVVYAPCALLLLFSYVRILATIRRLTRGASSDRKDRVRGIRTTVIILSAFVIATLPRLIVVFVLYQRNGGLPSRTDDLGNAVEDASSLFLSCNSLASPIIYSLTNRAFKGRLARIGVSASSSRRHSITSVATSRESCSTLPAVSGLPTWNGAMARKPS